MIKLIELKNISYLHFLFSLIEGLSLNNFVKFTLNIFLKFGFMIFFFDLKVYERNECVSLYGGRCAIYWIKSFHILGWIYRTPSGGCLLSFIIYHLLFQISNLQRCSSWYEIVLLFMLHYFCNIFLWTFFRKICYIFLWNFKYHLNKNFFPFKLVIEMIIEHKIEIWPH